MVSVGSAPAAGAVKVVVFCALAVTGFYFLLGAVTVAALHFADAADAVFLVGHDKYVHAARIVAQDVVGAASDEDAGLLLGGFADGLGLQVEEMLIAELVVIEVASAAHHRHQVAQYGAEETLLLVASLKHFGAESAFAGGDGQDFLVKVGYAEFLREAFADGAASAAELAAYVDDEGDGVGVDDGGGDIFVHSAEFLSMGRRFGSLVAGGYHGTEFSHLFQ